MPDQESHDQQDASAVASVAKGLSAAVVFLGAIGTRQCEIEHRLRNLPSTRKHLVCVDETGPGGYWLSRDLTIKDHVCGGVAPSVMPTKAGERVTTDRRDAVPWVRLRRSGALTPVDGPTVEDEAIRDLSRARADTLRALKAAKFRLKALLLRHDSRSTGRATWGPAHRRWRAAEVRSTPHAQRRRPHHRRPMD